MGILRSSDKIGLNFFVFVDHAWSCRVLLGNWCHRRRIMLFIFFWCPPKICGPENWHPGSLFCIFVAQIETKCWPLACRKKRFTINTLSYETKNIESNQFWFLEHYFAVHTFWQGNENIFGKRKYQKNLGYTLFLVFELLKKTSGAEKMMKLKVRVRKFRKQLKITEKSEKNFLWVFFWNFTFWDFGIQK